MKARLVEHVDLLRIVALLREQEYEVIAPFQGRARDTYFDRVTEDNQQFIQFHFTNPNYPPKRYLLPPIERLMNVRRQHTTWEIEPTLAAPKRALFGIRSCDVAAIGHLDRFYLGREFRDAYYEQRRNNLFLVNLVCSDPERDVGEACFCLCADTGPAARSNFDLQLMDLGTGQYMAVAGSTAGEALFSASFFRRGDESHIQKRRAVLAEVRQHFKASTSWFARAIREVSEGAVAERTWEEIGRRCLECGGCTYVCPACTCFTVSDRKVSATEIERVRLWDSCALGGFTRMAGGHNPRRAVHDRRNRRFFRKLAHYFIARELSMACVGCGRCAAVCHGDVGMPSVVELIRRAANPEGTSGSGGPDSAAAQGPGESASCAATAAVADAQPVL